jgi:OOP family OmpA-OmpF porin
VPFEVVVFLKESPMKALKSSLARTFAVLLCVAFLCGAVHAANRSDSFSLSPMIGGYIFEGDQDLDNALTYSLGLGYNLTDSWSTEFVLNYFNADTESSSGSDVDGLVYRLDALYHFMPGNALVPYVAGGLGGITLDPDSGDSDTDFLVNYGVGLKYFFTEDLAVRGDVRHIHAFGDPENNFVYTAGLTYLMGGKDDQPPAPLPVVDSDGDGITDLQDRCPGTPPGTAVDAAGCPLDTDSDGVYDERDQCPDTPAGVAVSPLGCPLDSDRDGVYDYLDKCPDTAAGTVVDGDGCPLDNDSDGDGISDDRDECPDTPAGLTVDEKGCPISITLSIEFDVDKYDIKPRYHNELAKGAAFIQKYSDQKILIAGHTDSTGTEAYNEILSQRRAESVRNYLIQNFGLDGDKLFARGFGETAPIAVNDTIEGRQHNRRVELSCCAVIPQ